MKTEQITNEAISKMHSEDCEMKIFVITYFDKKNNRERDTMCLNVEVRDGRVYYDIVGRTFHVPVKNVRNICAL